LRISTRLTRTWDASDSKRRLRRVSRSKALRRRLQQLPQPLQLPLPLLLLLQLPLLLLLPPLLLPQHRHREEQRERLVSPDGQGPFFDLLVTMEGSGLIISISLVLRKFRVITRSLPSCMKQWKLVPPMPAGILHRWHSHSYSTWFSVERVLAGVRTQRSPVRYRLATRSVLPFNRRSAGAEELMALVPPMHLFVIETRVVTAERTVLWVS
jgi:hypothetical protein